MGNEKDPIKKSVYNCIQLGFKVVANSFYG